MKKEGISLISLIITIIVIIILAAIVIFTGLNTPDRANFAKFTSEFSDFRTAVQQDYMQKKMQYAVEGKSRTDAQIYFSIAMGEDVSGRDGANINLEPTVENIGQGQYNDSDINDKIKYISGDGENALNLGGTGIQGTYAYLITNDTNVAEWKQDKKYYAPTEQHWVTDVGDVFVTPGYRVEEDGTEKWYLNERTTSDVVVASNTTGTPTNPGTTPTPTPPSGGSTSLTVKVGTTEGVTINKENLGQYLGKVVTNYTGASSVTIGGTTYNVSQQYRLYWIDFDNKYGEGYGTVYLKADKNNSNYSLPVTGSTSGELVHHFNPSIPTANITDSNNMRAVTWLLTPSNWVDLKTTGALAGEVKYIVGAPPLEMMMDSYNTCYGLSGDAPVAENRTSSGDRIKLFYSYTAGDYGYKVGPANSMPYDTWTGYYKVPADETRVGGMYQSGSGYYWLASPSATNDNCVMSVRDNNGGYVNGTYYTYNSALSPLVSLNSGVPLELSGT